MPISKLPFSEIFWHALIQIIPHRNCDNEEYSRIIEYTGQYYMHSDNTESIKPVYLN